MTASTGTTQNVDALSVTSTNALSPSPCPYTTLFRSFTVTLTGATAVPVSVDFATASGTAIGNGSSAGSATGSPRYLSKSGTRNFPAGTTVQTQTIDVLVCGDITFELAEAFTVTWTSA